MNSLASMLAPKSIAIVGASRKRTGPTGMLLDLVAEYPSTPPICIVNPSGESIDDLPTYATVAEMPSAVDLALCWCRRPRPNSARECAARASPTSQSSAAGSPTIATSRVRRQRRCAGHAETGVRILARNPGFHELVDGVPATFSPGDAVGLARYFDGDRWPRSNEPGAMSPSSRTAAAWVRAVQPRVARGVGFSYVISTGNEVDVESPIAWNSSSGTLTPTW